jgi:transposase
LLKEIPNGHTVIMDNAAFHRKKVLRKIARGKEQRAKEPEGSFLIICSLLSAI